MTILLFLSELKSSLDGELPKEEVLRQLQYYKDYMDSRLESESEEQITANLGDPRLIAKTLVETYRMTNPAHTHYEGHEAGSHSYREEDQSGQRTSYGRRGFKSSDTRKIKISRSILTLMGILIIVLIFVLMFFLGKVMIRLFFPLLIVGLVLMLVRKFRHR